MALRLSVINDEIAADPAHTFEVASQEFKLEYVDLRALWGKNIMRLDAKEIADARQLLERFHLRVGALATPLFKVDWKGAPKSKYSPATGQYGADFTFDEQGDVLDRAIALCTAFQTKIIRGFDFWRLADVTPHRAAIDEYLRAAAAKCQAHGVLLAIETEQECNTATGAEAQRLMQAVRHPALGITWDPGNAAYAGEVAYPDGYNKIPFDRILHLHCKDVIRDANGKPQWACMDTGIVDWVGQFRALAKANYKGLLALETHWHGAGTAEASSRQSLAGMRAQLARAGA